jgi:hypothetical protein
MALSDFFSLKVIEGVRVDVGCKHEEGSCRFSGRQSEKEVA